MNAVSMLFMTVKNKHTYLATHQHAPKAHLHDHQHADDHEHHSHILPHQNKLIWPFLITLIFALVEALGGWATNSLALIGDAGHMVSDAFALGLSLLGAQMAAKVPNEKYSYGLVRAEVLIALVNVLLMLMVVTYIVIEAIVRLQHPHHVQGEWVMVIAFFGLMVNLTVLKFLKHDHDHSGHQNLNTRAAVLHVFGDLLGSVAAVVAGAVIYFTGWLPIDPILSILLSCLILFSTFNLLHEVINVLMEAVPNHLNLVEVGDAMSAIDGVIEVHDVHIWHLSSSVVGLTSHVAVQDLKAWQHVLPEIRKMLHVKFRIDHVTLQPEIYNLNTHSQST